MSSIKEVSRTGVRFPYLPPMYITTLIENWHGNKESFISLTPTDVKNHLREHLDNWGCDYSEEEFLLILKNLHGFADEKSKTCVEVTITEVRPGETINQ